METNENAVSSDEEIVAEYDSTSPMLIVGDIDPYFNDTIALLGLDLIHDKIVFDSTYKYNRSYSFKEIAVSFYLNTDETEAHLGGLDGSYSFKISSTGGQVKCEFIDIDTLDVESEYSGSLINVAKLLPDKKIYKIRIEPENDDVPVSIDVEIFYIPYRNLGNKNIYKNTDSLTVRKGDIMTLHFKGSSEAHTWSSGNSKVVSINDTTGEMVARDFGKTTILVSNACGYCHRFEVTVVIDYVDIFDEGSGLQKVIFRSSDKTWYCVYRDSVFTDPADITAKRDNLNYFVAFDLERNQPLPGGIRDYANEELQLLFSIDPLGVSNYISRVTDDPSVVKTMNKKDKYFKLFFGRDPWYFDRDSSGNWKKVVKPTQNIDTYLSESELIMGKHAIWDEYAIKSLINDLIGLIFDILSVVLPAIGPIKEFLKSHQTVDDIIKIFQLCTCDGFEDLVSTTSEESLEEMYNNTAFAWANILMSATSIFSDFLDNVAAGDTLYPQVYEYCIGEYNYETYICKGKNTKYKLDDLRSYILNK